MFPLSWTRTLFILVFYVFVIFAVIRQPDSIFLLVDFYIRRIRLEFHLLLFLTSRVWLKRALKQPVVFTTLVLSDWGWVSRLLRPLLLMATSVPLVTWDRWASGQCSGRWRKGTSLLSRLPLMMMPLLRSLITRNVTVFVKSPMRVKFAHCIYMYIFNST